VQTGEGWRAPIEKSRSRGKGGLGCPGSSSAQLGLFLLVPSLLPIPIPAGSRPLGTGLVGSKKQGEPHPLSSSIQRERMWRGSAEAVPSYMRCFNYTGRRSVDEWARGEASTDRRWMRRLWDLVARRARARAPTAAEE
jgi:hypothetical protein